ncbi:LysR family transcriptional regulator [Parasporobacterium paucivorans]|uniref:DNA-binding transcriptional regulator, LysR family n=1 Tax=Parasporobacterium paucivorans DSM 15970 TaxID=1122934 RepID=A0A1M6BWN9_9FIRM|nr:LysR family transcriptional regulator [Parasporobacterium paucivorans]SHI53170.1 DNA-binding transcriptional regulator, LysR family [Parasporobacterium paucivorans DSM 15970]
MNITQIRYFITLAKSLNYTKAASQLYVTQPALSRQIQAMEHELNIMLFMRNNRTVKLTPAGHILLKEFEKIYNDYNLAVVKAQNSFQGLSGEINIGILDGAMVGDLFPEALRYFAKYHANVKINLRNYSFNGLIEHLYDNTLDLIITLRFDVKCRERIGYKVIEETRDHVVVHSSHRLAGARHVKLSDFKDDVFIMVDTTDSEESPKLILDAFKKQGVMPIIKVAPSIQTEMLWVQAGVGVCVLDSRNMLRDDPTVKFLDVDEISDPSLTMAWNIDNYNPVKQTFIDVFFNESEYDK